MAVKTRRTRSTKLRTILLPLLNQPPTFPLSTSSADRARAPNPDVLILSQERIPYDAPPSIAEAALHLLLLEVFWQLFQRLDSEAERYKNTEHGKSLRGRYLLNAVQRFEVWWAAVAKEVQIEHEVDMKTESENADTGEFVKTRPLKPHHQPPLDVMLVWHTYLLNPGWYEKDCRRIHGEGMLTVAYPWDMIRQSVDQDTLTYTLPRVADEWFTSNVVTSSEGSDLLKHLQLLQSSTPASPIRNCQSLHGCECAPPSPSSSSPSSSSPPPASAGPSICLSSGIIRQLAFTNKMHHLLFLRSPTLLSTLTRAETRYLRFFDLFRLHPGQTLVPTLDVDLIWHTQQLSPLRYRKFCSAPERAHRWIDHDDTIAKGELDTSFTNTERWYRKLYGERYGGCLCWNCELRRDEEGWERADDSDDGADNDNGGNENIGDGERENKDVEPAKWWQVRRMRRKWERRVVVEFWRQVEGRREAVDEVGLRSDGLVKVLGVPVA